MSATRTAERIVSAADERDDRPVRQVAEIDRPPQVEDVLETHAKVVARHGQRTTARLPGPDRRAYHPAIVAALHRMTYQLPAAALAPILLFAAAAAAQQPAAGFEKDVLPFLRRYCVDCHGVVDPDADIDLVGTLDGPLDADALDVLIDIRDVLKAHDMPPSDEAQPDADQRARIVAWAGHLLATAAGTVPVDPGRVTMRRLSRYEYANTVRDLLGVAVDVTGFPADDLGYGFDNIGDALTVSALHLENYALAAEKIAAEALPDPDGEKPPILVRGPEAMACSLDDAQRGEVLVMITNARATCSFTVPRPGRYVVRVVAHATQAGDELARMEVTVDGTRVEGFDVEAERTAPRAHTVEIDVVGRRLEVGAAFVNDFYDPRNPDPRRRDRNLMLHRIEVEGPVDVREATAAERWLLPEAGTGRVASRTRRVLRPLMERAWRRPVSRAEVSRLTRLVEQTVRDGETSGEALRWGVQAVLLSPHFLFRVEVARDAQAGDQDVGEHALATRLSYLLWSSLPDQALRDRADAGELSDVEVLVAEARRMLRDRRASALAENFAGQWFELRRLHDIAPDPDRFPEWTPQLASSARRETELLFDAVLRDGLPARALIDADFTFVDRLLADHYGLKAPDGDGFERIEVVAPRIGGVLGHASVLALTSNPTRTSPVKRGKWILDSLLDSPPPPPPPGNDSFAAEAAIDSSKSLREQMAEHRSRPICSVCHVRMDALGLALENFDPLGRYRVTDAGGTIDARSTLPDGRMLDGARSVQRLLAESDSDFGRALLRKLFVYAVGRGVRPADAVLLQGVALGLDHDATLEDFVIAIVRLDAFRRRAAQE